MKNQSDKRRLGPINISNLFEEIILLSIMGSFTAMGILFVKKLFNQKLSAKFHYCIWFILIARLVIPFSLSSPINMFDFIPQTQLENIYNNSNMWNITDQGPQKIGATDVNEYNDAGNNVKVQVNATGADSKSLFNELGFNLKTAAIIWFTVFIMILFYICFVNLMLTLKLRKFSSCQRQDITDLFNLCKLKLKINSTVIILYDNQLKSPMLCGYVHPKILINKEIIERLSHDELRYVFLHELSHLKRKDLVVSLVGMILQSIYWFNPIMLYSIHQMKKDCEIACDASVLSILNAEENKKYGQTIISMLKLLSEATMVHGTLGFASKFYIRRITMITRFKKSSAKYTVAALMITLLLTGCSSFTHSTSTPDSADKSAIVNTQTQTAVNTVATVSSTSKSQIAETEAAQSDIKDSIIYIADISKSLRGIDRYSLTENGEIVTGIGIAYVFGNDSRYFNIDQTEISNFENFATIADKKYSSGAFVKCRIKSVGHQVKEIYLIDSKKKLLFFTLSSLIGTYLRCLWDFFHFIWY